MFQLKENTYDTENNENQWLPGITTTPAQKAMRFAVIWTKHAKPLVWKPCVLEIMSI